MGNTSTAFTALADAAALLDLPDRMEHLQEWLSQMLGQKWQIPNDPIAEFDQAEAVLMGIRAELTERGFFLPEVVAARVDPIGFLRDGSVALWVVSRYVRSIPAEMFYASFATKH